MYDNTTEEQVWEQERAAARDSARTWRKQLQQVPMVREARDLLQAALNIDCPGYLHLRIENGESIEVTAWDRAGTLTYTESDGTVKYLLSFHYEPDELGDVRQLLELLDELNSHPYEPASDQEQKRS